ncbi:MAG: D-2-hydroxyacid dehydrogenase [Proteobacteria bacterium]|nr:D-2-hydroxyacid dehydrogenase [Pseudomonadota bacterium]
MKQRRINTIAIAYGLVLNEFSMTEPNLDRIRKAAPEARLVVIKDKEDWEKQSDEIASEVDVVFGLRPGAWFDKMPNLRWAQQTGAGANWLLDMPEVVESDMILTNASGVHAIPIAEHILALMFAFSRNIHFKVRSQADGKWDRRGRGRELDGSTLGLIGVGSIGEKTAEKAKGLNMKVLGVRRNPDRSSPYVDAMYGPDGLEKMLYQSDWVAITAAMTSETEGLIGETQLKAMKRTAVVINIARGPMIQEAVLIKALQEGWIKGAGLDVFEQEPLPEDSPLWEMDNVIVTPHVAGATPFYVDRLIDIFTENLQRYQVGESLINVVDKRLGY